MGSIASVKPELKLDECVGLSLRLRSEVPLRVEWPEPGILCIGAGPFWGLPGLIALCEGDSADRSLCDARDAPAGVQGLLAFLQYQWSLSLAVKLALVVLWAPNSGWRHLPIRWHGREPMAGTPTSVTWPMADQGGDDALVGALGLQGQRILAVLDSMVGAELLEYPSRG